MLREAEVAAVAIPQVTASWPGLDVDDAYAIQLENVRLRESQGEAIVGQKVGLTSKAMQEMLGVGEPDYGHLLAEMVVPDGGSLPAASFCSPRAEIEIGFVLRDDLTGPGCTADDVREATAFVCAAIEVIDSRIADWKLTLADTVADNGSSARVVLGSDLVELGARDLRGVRGVIEVNGEPVESGLGSAVLGDPLAAVAWLANKLAELEITLRAGGIVLPGAVARAVPVTAGQRVRGIFDGLGAVSVEFT